MDNLDLELIKKMAEIEGITHWVNWDGPNDGFIDLCNPMGDEGPKLWNPLTNKALLWDLFVKYEAEIDYKEGKIWIEFGDCKQDLALSIFDCLDKDTIPRAVLECIVEANNV